MGVKWVSGRSKEEDGGRDASLRSARGAPLKPNAAA